MRQDCYGQTCFYELDELEVHRKGWACCEEICTDGFEWNLKTHAPLRYILSKIVMG